MHMLTIGDSKTKQLILSSYMHMHFALTLNEIKSVSETSPYLKKYVF